MDLPLAIMADSTRLQATMRCSPNSRGAHNSNSTYSCGTRLARIDFPRFGGYAIQQWIYQCETYIVIDGTPEDFKWDASFVKTLPRGNLPNWTEFTGILVDRFGAIDDDPMSDLMKLQQTGSMVEYHDQFDLITYRLNLNLRKAFHLTKLYESISSSNTSTKFSLKSPSTYTNTKAILPTPKPLNKLIDTQIILHTNQRHSNKKLTPAFMTERRSKGLCYFCDEPYSPAYALTHKKLEIHVLEVSDNEEEIVDQLVDIQEDDNPSLDPHISVNALTGIATFKTMRVTGYFKKKPLHILIDSGSTHNFLDESVAKNLGYPLTVIPPLSVAVADGPG
ncbi:hypothetical protein V8G54_022184 [Vigna mungo]|uniref:Retrotransposon gag domain-containing protein n=1 Tax=Vigna mungo TaxID=3915 RepID=A0AAQ3RXL4_VIGMU